MCSHGIALFLEHMDDEQEPKISSEISPHINDKQLGRLNSYDARKRLLKKFANERLIMSLPSKETKVTFILM